MCSGHRYSCESCELNPVLMVSHKLLIVIVQSWFVKFFYPWFSRSVHRTICSNEMRRNDCKFCHTSAAERIYQQRCTPISKWYMRLSKLYTRPFNLYFTLMYGRWQMSKKFVLQKFRFNYRQRYMQFRYFLFSTNTSHHINRTARNGLKWTNEAQNNFQLNLQSAVRYTLSFSYDATKLICS